MRAGTILVLTGLTNAYRLAKDRELEGIDTSNIVTGNRRSRRAAAPINYAALEAVNSSEDNSSADDAQNGAQTDDAQSNDSSDDDQQEGKAEDEEMQGVGKIPALHAACVSVCLHPFSF